jgi:hypothetical protein
MWERPDEGAIGYPDHEGSRAGGSGLTDDPSVGSSCMSDDLHESRFEHPTKQGRPRPVNPLVGLGPSPPVRRSEERPGHHPAFSIGSLRRPSRSRIHAGGLTSPITAIRLADTDGNPATVADPSWMPFVQQRPAAHDAGVPEHPSGHTAISGAVVETLKNFFGTDKVSFTMFSGLSGTSPEFDRFSVAMREIIDARVWARIHFRTAHTQGHAMGRKVARNPGDELLPAIGLIRSDPDPHGAPPT